MIHHLAYHLVGQATQTYVAVTEFANEFVAGWEARREWYTQHLGEVITQSPSFEIVSVPMAPEFEQQSWYAVAHLQTDKSGGRHLAGLTPEQSRLPDGWGISLRPLAAQAHPILPLRQYPGGAKLLDHMRDDPQFQAPDVRDLADLLDINPFANGNLEPLYPGLATLFRRDSDKPHYVIALDKRVAKEVKNCLRVSDIQLEALEAVHEACVARDAQVKGS